VVCAHPEATYAGLSVLNRGGNAIDAMLTVHFALAVVYPTAGNIGGGGFMLLREQDGQTHALDFREKAPAGASRNMFQDEEGEVVPGLSVHGRLAAAVPGSVDGMLTAHERFGSLPLKELLAPAIRLAEYGFTITNRQAKNFNRYQEDFIRHNRNGRKVPLVKGEEWEAGDVLVQPQLAATLRRIQQQGKAGFYEGETARLLIREMQEGGGIMTARDLQSYESVWRKPVEGFYKGVKVIGMPPPSSGGIALLQLLGMSAYYPLNDWGHKAAKTVHVMAEMERRVYADRARHLGDPDFWDVPARGLLDSAYLHEQVRSIELQRATPSTKVRPLEQAYAPQSEETTHYSIVDTEGNAVSVTTTINAAYGAKVFVEGAGFLLNNQMDDFSIKPGLPNMYGLIGGEANAIEPGKRMLSSMTPTILEKDGHLLMVLGTPGGSTIITSVYQTIMNVLEHDMKMEEAVAAGRFHHQWMPDQIYFEEGALSPSVQDSLRQLGHRLQKRSPIGRVDAILRQPDGSLRGVGDPRGDDWAGGF
jgi:gamma-glutamyltranspeptidase/glutathione hydrolase